MRNKPQFLGQEKRDLYSRKAQEIEQKMLRVKKETEFYKTYNEAIKLWIPEIQQRYCDSPAFIFLCQMIKKYCEGEEFEEGRESLRVAKENFESYCEMMEDRC